MQRPKRKKVLFEKVVNFFKEGVSKSIGESYKIVEIEQKLEDMIYKANGMVDQLIKIDTNLNVLEDKRENTVNESVLNKYNEMIEKLLITKEKLLCIRDKYLENIEDLKERIDLIKVQSDINESLAGEVLYIKDDNISGLMKEIQKIECETRAIFEAL